MYATLKPKDLFWSTPITLKQRVNTVKVLLDQGADVNIQNEVR